MWWRIGLGFLLLLSIQISTARRRESHHHLSVELQSGAVVTGQSIVDGDVASFTGIPYADPPIGRLRLAKPVSRVFSSDEVINATITPPACLQARYEPEPPFLNPQLSYSEDCLYLNVFTRPSWLPAKPHRLGESGGKRKRRRRRKGRAVLFYIHGGSFSNGDGISRDGTALVTAEGVVVVSVNYRLQWLGFLNVDEGGGVPHNLGMWDIVTALQWVQDHIYSFGGDPRKVTIMGESAGGAIVTYLHTSPLTLNLFSRSIAISGTMEAPWALTKPTSEVQGAKWRYILGATDCHAEEDVLKCLRSVDQDKILEVMNGLIAEVDRFDTWPPVVDGELVVADPKLVVKAGRYLGRPLLSGICHDEGLMPTQFFGEMNGIPLSLATDNLESVADLEKLSFDNSLALFPCMSAEGRDQLVQLYTSETTSLKESLGRLVGDWLLFCPQILTASSMSRSGASVYQYIFNFLSPTVSGDPDVDWMGVKHGADLAYLFGLPHSTSSPYSNSLFWGEWTPTDTRISVLMMNVVGGFVKRGKPNMGMEKRRVCWRDTDKYLYVMDKYVKRLSTEEVEEMRRAKRPRLKQATLQSLKGVIDVKRVLELKKILECKRVTDTQILDCLTEIEAGRCLPVQILTDTGIGRAIGPLRKHSNSDVADKARLLVQQWKRKIEDLPVAPVVNVQKKQLSLLMDSGGGNDEEVRKKAVAMFRGANSGEEGEAKLWEKKIYVENNMKIDKNYRMKVRQKVFELKKNQPSSSRDVVET